MTFTHMFHYFFIDVATVRYSTFHCSQFFIFFILLHRFISFVVAFLKSICFSIFILWIEWNALKKIIKMFSSFWIFQFFFDAKLAFSYFAIFCLIKKKNNIIVHGIANIKLDFFFAYALLDFIIHFSELSEYQSIWVLCANDFLLML